MTSAPEETWPTIGLGVTDEAIREAAEGPEPRPLAAELAVEFNSSIRAHLDADGSINAAEVACAALAIIQGYLSPQPGEPPPPEKLVRQIIDTVEGLLLPKATTLDEVTEAALALRSALFGLPEGDRPKAVTKASQMIDEVLVERDSHDRRVAFAKGQINGGSLVIVGIPAGAWRYMRHGKTHHFDLTKAGVPVSFMLFGATDYEEARRLLDGIVGSAGMTMEDRSREDWSIGATTGKRKP